MDFISNLHQSFTLPEKNLSLPHVASLYSTNDYRALTIEKDFDAKFSALMKSCIHEVTSKACNDFFPTPTDQGVCFSCISE